MINSKNPQFPMPLDKNALRPEAWTLQETKKGKKSGIKSTNMGAFEGKTKKKGGKEAKRLDSR